MSEVNSQQSEQPKIVGGQEQKLSLEMFNERPSFDTSKTLTLAQPADRMIALFIDGFAVAVAHVVATIVLGFIPYIGMFMPLAVSFGYFFVLHQHWGWTIGRKLMKVHVAMPDGSKPSQSVYATRWFVSMISGTFLGLGYIIGFFDERFRTLHDRAAGTIVVKD